MIFSIETKKRYDTTDEFKDYLAKMDEKLSEITHLDLSYNTYVPAVACEISERIKKMKNLKKIKMESIMDSLNREQMIEVGTLIFNSLPSTLEELDISSNALSCNYPEAIGTFLGKCSLKTLSFYDCGLGEDGLIRLVNHLKLLKDKSNLKVLNIGKNRINVLPKDFTDLFNEFVNLCDFRLQANTIDEKSMYYFFKNAIGQKLKVLDVSDNFITNECPAVLGELFKRASELEELFLFDGKMNDGDLYKFLTVALDKKIDTSLKTKPKLTLDVSFNGFEQNCVPLLEKMANIYDFQKLIISENLYEDIDNLVNLVFKSGGIVVTEDDLFDDVSDNDLIKNLKKL